MNSGENDDEEENSRHSVSSTTNSIDNRSNEPKSAFHLILQRSSLARSMKAVFEELSSTGESRPFSYLSVYSSQM